MMRAVLVLALVGGLGLAGWVIWGQGGPTGPGEDGIGDAGAEGAAEASGPGLEGSGDGTLLRGEDADTLDGPGWVEVLVVDVAGKPLAGVPVTLDTVPFANGKAWQPPRSRRAMVLARLGVNYVAPRELARLTTGDDGLVRFEGLSDTRSYVVRARAASPRAPTKSHPFSLRNWRRGSRFASKVYRRLVLEVPAASSPLALRVVDADGAGIRARIFLYARDDEEARKARQAATGAPNWQWGELATGDDGRASVAGVPNGIIHATVLVPGVGRRSPIPIETPATGEVVLSLATTDGARLVGTIRRLDGQPVAGATILAASHRSPDGDDPGEATSGAATTDADGRYEIAGLSAGKLNSVQLSAPGHLYRRLWQQSFPDRELVAGGTIELDLVLPRACVVSGVVVDEAGTPVPDARVHVRVDRNRGHGNRFQIGSDRTNSRGAFRIDTVPPGKGRATASAEGFAMAKQEEATNTYELESPGDEATVRIVLAPGIPVEGIVVDASGEPVPGATVMAGTVRKDDPHTMQNTRGTTVSKVDGTFRFAGLQPDEAMHVAARTETQFALPIAHPLKEGESPPTLRIALRDGASIEGVLVGASDAELSGLRLRLSRDRWNRTANADKAGAFRFQGLPAGTYQLRVQVSVSIPGRARDEDIEIELAEGEARTGLRVPAPAVGTIAGVLVDAEGEPVAHQWIQLHRQAKGGSASTSTHGGADGSFRFRHVPVGEYELRVQGKAVATVRPGEEDLRLEVGAGKSGTKRTIKGRVLLPDGAPVAAGTVMLRYKYGGGSHGSGFNIVDGRVAVEWGGGRFASVLERDGEGTWSLEVERVADIFGRAVNVAPKSIDPFDPETAEEFEIQLEAGVEIAGVVVDEAGEPVRNIHVAVGEHARFHGAHATRTDNDGRFRLLGLAPGEHKLQVTRPQGFMPYTPMMVAGGRTDVRVVLRRGAEILGVVMDPEGKPVPKVQLSFQAMDATGKQVRGWARSEEDGTFRISGLVLGVTGSVHVHVRNGGESGFKNMHVRDVAVGTKDLEIRLAVGVFIEGRAILPEGVSPSHVNVWCRWVGDGPAPSHHSARADPKTGAFRIGPLEPGPYTVVVHAGSGLPQTEAVTISAPAKDVLIPVEVGHQIRGKIEVENPQGFHILWRSTMGETNQTIGANVKQDGTFLVASRWDQKGSLYATRQSDGLVAKVEGVRPSEGPFTLRPEPGLSITGRVENRPENLQYLHVVANGDIHIVAMAKPDGTFELRGLFPGRYTLQAHASNLSATREDVTAGSTGIVLHLENAQAGR